LRGGDSERSNRLYPEFVTNPVGHFALSAIKDGQSAGLHFGHLHQPATDFRFALIQHDHFPVRVHQPDRTPAIVERILGVALLFWNRNFTSGGWVDGWVPLIY
jgi:hypothetical protein